MVQRQRIPDSEGKDHGGEIILGLKGGKQILWRLLTVDRLLPTVL